MAEVKTPEERLQVCRGCEFFHKKTQSCGTLILGDVVTYKGKKFTLCGCLMPVKVEFPSLHCSVGKW